MPPRKRQKGLAKGATTIKWDEQPEVEGGTFETPYGARQLMVIAATGDAWAGLLEEVRVRVRDRVRTRVSVRVMETDNASEGSDG